MESYKVADKARYEHIDSSPLGYAASGAQARTFSSPPPFIPVVEIWKNPDPAMLEFSFSGHPPGSVPEPF